MKAAISVDASQAPSDTTQNRIGNAGVLSEARYLAPKASVSYSWEDEKHMRWGSSPLGSVATAWRCR